jgi:hypothetical protein
MTPEETEGDERWDGRIRSPRRRLPLLSRARPTGMTANARIVEHVAEDGAHPLAEVRQIVRSKDSPH